VVSADARLAPIRRRVRVARATLAVGSLALFGAAAGLARIHFAGHAKQDVTPLAPPDGLLRVVRHNQLSAGVLAPADAPPGIGSAPS
jgi:hypothetical protein